MMKSFIYRTIILAFVAMTMVACTQDEPIVSGNAEMTITYRPSLDGIYRADIGDASGIDQLIVTVYEGDGSLTQKLSYTQDWYDAKRYGVALTLLEGHSYKILFWAQDADNTTAYTINNNGTVSVNYDAYRNSGFALMEQMDAFCGVSTITVGSQANEHKSIVLSRPLAQLNFADNATAPTQGTHQAVVTFHSIPTAYNPFTKEVAMSDANNDADDITFTFTDFPAETLTVGSDSYYYLACNYLFANDGDPDNTKVDVTIDLQTTSGASIKKHRFTGDKVVDIDPNMKTNLYGTLVQQPQSWSKWNGIDKTPITQDANNRYIIGDATDLAWLLDNAGTLDENKTFVLTTDIDMDNHALSSIQLPAGSTLDGGSHTIKGLNLTGALLGDATNLTVNDLTIDESNITSTTHTGALVNTLKGSATFTNVTVQNTDITTSNGAAGGVVGYIVRKSANDRSEQLEVSFDNCHVIETSIQGTTSNGHFVGLLRGYDNGETLQFNDNCTLTLSQTATIADDFVSPYTEGNEGAWLASNDYSKYNGWLGNEECYRAQVYYGANRFIPRWDGVINKSAANIEPLLADATYDEGVTAGSHRYVVYSAFDLAGVRAKTNGAPAAIYLMENVDMNGQGADGKFFVHSKFTKSAADSKYSTTDDDNHFRSFDYVDYLEGNEHDIYNLSIYSTYNGATTYYGAFILYCRNTTVHQNVNLRNCCTVVPHVVKDNEDKSYGAAFVCNNDCATYTMQNVHAYNCSVFALQKTGTLIGRLGVNNSGTISDCSVNDCYIENYNCKEHQESFASIVKFYTPGEVGGMFGFVEDQATITNCHVRRTTIHAYGQNDKNYIFYKIPGRHVSKFIGDIRTSENTDDSKDVIKMTNCTVDDATTCTQRYDKHSSKYTTIGKVYYVSLAGDKKGTVTYDGEDISF